MKNVKQPKMKHLALLLIGAVFSSCSSTPGEVNIKDCNAYGGVIRYEGELFTGTVKKYFDDGTVQWEFYVIDGVTDGERKEYRSDGSSEVTVYDMGTVKGVKYYDAENNLIEEWIYDDDGGYEIVRP